MENLQNISRYEIESEIGRGSMGIVYQARDPRINRLVALKVVDLSSRWIEEGSASAAEEFRERFIREAQIAGKLSHPGIVIIYDAGEEKDLCFIAMEYVPGPSLKRLFRENYTFSLRQVTAIISKAASALDYAHSMGIVHRDIKPGNIIIKTPPPGNASGGGKEGVDPLLIDFLPDGSDLEAKLVDFGIARFEGSDLTKEGLVIGSPSYMSPEQIRGKRVDGSSDQFSLGVVAYELITGQKPFVGEDIKAIGWQIISDDPTPPSEIRQDIPAHWDEILLRAMEKQQEDRFDSLSEFAEALAAEIPPETPEKSDRTRVSKEQKLDTWRTGSYKAETKSSGRQFDPDSSPPWAESSIVDSIIQSKTLEARGWTPTPRKQREKESRFWIWYILILCFFGGIIFTLILWLR